MKTAQLPNPIRILCGSAAAWWLSVLAHPSFFGVAVMLLLMLPIVLTELYFVFPEKFVVSHRPSQEENSIQEDTGA